MMAESGRPECWVAPAVCLPIFEQARRHHDPPIVPVSAQSDSFAPGPAPALDRQWPVICLWQLACHPFPRVCLAWFLERLGVCGFHTEEYHFLWFKKKFFFKAVENFYISFYRAGKPKYIKIMIRAHEIIRDSLPERWLEEPCPTFLLHAIRNSLALSHVLYTTMLKN